LLKIAINKIIIKFAIKKDNDKLGVETTKKKDWKKKDCWVALKDLRIQHHQERKHSCRQFHRNHERVECVWYCDSFYDCDLKKIVL